MLRSGEARAGRQIFSKRKRERERESMSERERRKERKGEGRRHLSVRS